MNEESKKFYKKIYLLYGREFSFSGMNSSLLYEYLYVDDDCRVSNNMNLYFESVDFILDKVKFTDNGLEEIGCGIN